MVRVLSWNLWWRFGDWRARRRLILEVLAETAPDICGLQEVWQDDEENLAESLAGELGLRWAWGPARNQRYWQRRIRDDSVRHGTAVLSRWPIERTRVTILSDAHARTALSALVRTPDGLLPFHTAHLSAHGDVRFRCDQVQRLCRAAVDWGPGDLPAVLTGDFNARPASPVLDAVRGHFTDAWPGAAGPGHTWLTGDAEAPGGAMSVRIDYVLVGAGGSLTVRSAAVAADEPRNALWASDHAAVVVDLVAVRRSPDRHGDGLDDRRLLGHGDRGEHGP
ncbi:endonuclease/exonuclease/phosphatase family protein [Amycolatopsis sp. FBCC-B4732]|uniref:endonuclease/exonuclease/phosphatase family protein n=1 Tax=Amycolatopsis sp. FBCC-B4732 TaxID=3079339 RepID=UPI001FF2C32D|nr:endonuclease/exonuclease/phosphatase family protein [Amycolatopsis sp. FBCC-B4732]UOX90695.1 endonuclease/exonuclease/phosphatase family protein [Amycolatopsis sp. FBCC-B4732]